MMKKLDIDGACCKKLHIAEGRWDGDVFINILRGESESSCAYDGIVLDTAGAKGLRDYLNDFLGDAKDMTAEINRAVEEIARRNDDAMVERDKVVSYPVGAPENLEDRVKNLEKHNETIVALISNPSPSKGKGICPDPFLRSWQGLMDERVCRQAINENNLEIDAELKKLDERISKLEREGETNYSHIKWVMSQTSGNSSELIIHQRRLEKIEKEPRFTLAPEQKEWLRKSLDEQNAILMGIGLDVVTKRIDELKAWKDKVCGDE